MGFARQKLPLRFEVKSLRRVGRPPKNEQRDHGIEVQYVTIPG
jgi:hypothetical protein